MSWKDTGDTVQAFVAAAGIVVGGIFTYFKFIKDRVYRPRVDLAVDAGLVDLGNGERHLVCRLSVTNKGATKLALSHEGTAVIIRTGKPGWDALDQFLWSDLGESAVVDVFAKHDWLESTETIREDVAVRASTDLTCMYRVELRLNIVHPSPGRRDRITINTSRVVPSTQTLSPNAEETKGEGPHEPGTST
jgi:hypothetical protein